MRIVTLTTCHNRLEKTLKALCTLHSQNFKEFVELSHVIVDDGSVDGTKQAVSDQFPNVEIVCGEGDLYWAGGMRFGWEQSVKKKNFDFLLAYNDDVEFFADAVQRLINVVRVYEAASTNAAYAVVGSCRSKFDHSTTYGGQVRRSRLNRLSFERTDPPVRGYREVDTLNMNCALITHRALNQTDFLAPYFLHGAADFEFGVRLQTHGGSVVLAPGYFAYCERNDGQEPITDSLSGYLKKRMSVKQAPPSALSKYYKAHGGLLWPYFFMRHYVTKVSLKLLLSGRWFR